MSDQTSNPIEKKVRIIDLLHSYKLSKNLYSDTWRSNAFTQTAVAEAKPEMKPSQEFYKQPSREVVDLRAKMIAEEAIETLAALGYWIDSSDFTGFEDVPETDPRHKSRYLSIRGEQAKHLILHRMEDEVDIHEMIDGCCDVNYVTVGTLTAFGIPDIPHQQEVNDANNNKFPEGKATLADDGKFLKPEGWEGPNHREVERGIVESIEDLHFEYIVMATDSYLETKYNAV